MDLYQCLDAAPSPRKGPDQTRRPNREVRAPAQNPGATDRRRARPKPAWPTKARRRDKTAFIQRRRTVPGPTIKTGSRKFWHTPAWARAAAVSSSSSRGASAINGEIIRQLGTKVDPSSARITVDGEPIKLESMVYYAVNKPKGYVSTNSDPSGRPRVVDLLPEIPERVYTVGRLDEASTGLLILTNDGELANRLAHPRYGVEKIYRALVAGLPTPEMMAKLTEGVWLSDGKVRAKRARIVSRQGQATMLELVLAEGKKREIRRMLVQARPQGHVAEPNRRGPDQPQRALRRRMPFALPARNRAAPQSRLGRLGGTSSILRWQLIEPTPWRTAAATPTRAGAFRAKQRPRRSAP